MNQEHIQAEYDRWRTLADPSLQRELTEMDEKTITNAFFRNLEFGTGGLRGEIGPGTNRMNIHTVAKATQGLAAYLLRSKGRGCVAISYDSRILSDTFARVAAQVFSSNGISVYLYDRLMPTPCLSFAVRALECVAGVMITASHNPAQYNGYKVYGSDGCQITTETANQILAEIEKVDLFADVVIQDFEEAVKKGEIRYVPESVLDDYLTAVKAQSLLGDESVDKSFPIVYTPLNGTGREPVLRILKECGYDHVVTVSQQEMPDGRFPTCPYPNPEEREALSLGISRAGEVGAELVLATDPDCDRVGAAVLEGEEYVLLTGNEMGLLLLDYVCTRRKSLGIMPAHPVFIKTIVTSELGRRIAALHGVETKDVLTGFKFIGEQIGLLEQQGRVDDYILGFEESYGYLSGSYVRDKDGVDAALLICEMTAYHRARGLSLIARLEELYRQVGYCKSTLLTFAFPGAEGFERMQGIMERFRQENGSLGEHSIVQVLDYTAGIDGLPKSNVLMIQLEDESCVVIRPSGTEPKLKAYFSVYGSDREVAEAETEKLQREIQTIIEFGEK